MLFNLLTINFILATLSIYKYINSIYIVFLIILGIYLFFKIFIQKKIKKFNKKSITLLIFIVITLFISNIFISDDIYIILKNILFIYNIILIYLLIYLKGKKYCKEFFVQIRNIGFILAIFSIIENIFRLNIMYQFIIDPEQKQYLIQSLLVNDYRVASIFGHGIVYGNFLVCIFFIGIYCKFKNIFLRYTFNLIIIINIYLTRSRSIWIAFVIMLIFQLISNINIKKINKNIYIKIFVSIAIILFITIFMNNQIEILFKNIVYRFAEMNTSLGEASKIQRIGTIYLIINKIFSGSFIQMLIGHGYGSVNYVMLSNTVYINNFATTDNQYISIMYNFGLIITITYIIFLIKIIIELIKDNLNKMYKLNIILLIGNSITMFFYTMFSWKGIFNLFLCSIIYLNLYKNNKFEEIDNES